MKRIIISTFLIFAIVLSNISVIFANSEATLSPLKISEITDAKYTILKGLGVLDGINDANQNDVITRGEFAKMVANLVGYNKGYTQQFGDVNEEHKYFNEINSLATSKVISGYNDNNFYPDNDISLEQAMMVCINFLGYNKIMKDYDNSVSKMGLHLGLQAGVNAIFSDNLTYVDGITLMYNTLDVDVLELIGAGTNITYKTFDGKTILTKKDIYKARGQVNATPLTFLNKASGLPKGKIAINGEVYLIGASDINKYLGYAVEVYYKMKDTDDDKTILSYTIDKSNEVQKVTSKDIQSYNNGTLTYTSGKNTAKLNIDINSDFIFNSVCDGEISLKDYIANAKTYYEITYLENSKGSIVFIDEYNDAIVDDKNVSENKIYLKYGKTTLDLDNMSNRKIINIRSSNGEKLAISNISKDNILTYKMSKDKNYIDIVVSNKTTMGVINGLEYDNTALVCGEQSYEISESYKAEIEDANSLYQKPSAGLKVKLFINSFGKVVAISSNGFSSGLFGYTMNANYDQASIERTVKIKLFALEKNDEVVFKFADKVLINSTQEKTSKIVDAVKNTGNFEPLFSGGKIKHQLIKYYLNSDGEIREIVTEGHTKMKKEFSSASINYFAGTIHPKYQIDGATKVLLISGDAMKNPLLLEEKESYVAFSGREKFLHDTIPGPAYGFNATESNVIEALVIECSGYSGASYMTRGSVDVKSKSGIVTGNSQGLNEDGEEKVVISMMVDGAAVKFFAEESDLKNQTNSKWTKYAGRTVKDIKVGDVMQYGLNSKGEMSAFCLLSSLDSNGNVEYAEQWASSGEPTEISIKSGCYTNVGIITKKSGDYVMINATTDPNWERTALMKSTTDVTIYNITNKKATKGTKADISVYDNAMLVMVDMEPKDIYIFKK